MTDEVEMVEVIDTARIGTKGYPRHYAPLGLDPPMKLVPKEAEPAVAPETSVHPVEPDPNAVPAVVSAAQARLALLNAGLLDAVKAAVEQADEATQIWFEYATEWQRDTAVLNALGDQLGLSSGQIDDLFKAAAAL